MADENLDNYVDGGEAPKEGEARLIAGLEGFLRKVCYKQLVEASENLAALVVKFKDIDEYNSELSQLLLEKPKDFFSFVEKATASIELPNKVPFRVCDMPKQVNVRDLRSAHIGKFISVEGVVRKSSEVRPEIMQVVWVCPECEKEVIQERQGNFVSYPSFCDCGNRKGFKQKEKSLIDTRWIVIEEPFELTEGERPSQVTIFLTEDLISSDMRRISDPGNRIRVTGILTDTPKTKSAGNPSNVRLDFYMDANHIQQTEEGWEKMEIKPEDEEIIKQLASDPEVYKTLVASIAPSLYGLEEIKESIILQLFGGVHRTLLDGTKFRGDIHVLLIGDPAAGKSQLLKLVPQIVPRGKYVSGKGATATGLTATVTKDEQFMGGWVLEAGAMVLANKGLLAIDEFEKMAPEDQVAMHEALEQGSVSIAKASIMATLPAQTSVLAGGNPKFSRFDPYLPISKQITIPDTLLSRFDLKFILKDVPNEDADKRLTEHMLRTRDDDFESSKPKLDKLILKKYISYAKDKVKPRLTKETGKTLKNFYVSQRKRAEGGSAPVPITLRQFEALIRLSEASAKVQLSDVVRKEDAERAIRLMRFSLVQLGTDPGTGMIDVDRSEGSVSSSERSAIRVVLDIIGEMSATNKDIKVDDIVERAKKKGVNDPAEMVDKLKREGLLFEPTPGFVRKL